MFSIHTTEQLLKVTALVSAVISVLIGAWYLVRRPHLQRVTKALLFLGLGVFPAIVSLTGNIASFEYTLSRPFCGSCHVMSPYLRDAEDPQSNSLAALHSRNHKFGETSCYTCHADYQMFGAMTTKLNGMRHLFQYVTVYASTGPDGEGGPPIHLYKPFKSELCMQCHSTTAKKYVETHEAALEGIRAGETSCIDCHSEVHPLALSRRAGGAKGAKP
ncbi:MAG: NapC/NirT family cytochrome c [Deltaproteobacteria bacterium]|nr:NapC/NirT family cytochrome c [Deltaproteobacteria bacterium]